MILGDIHIKEKFLEEIELVFSEILSIKEKEGITETWILGDVFDTVKPLSSELDSFSRFIKNFDSAIIISAKSHETISAEQSVLNHFSILNPQYKVYYNQYIVEYTSKTKFLLGHYFLNESLVNEGAEHSLKELENKYKFIFLGHCVTPDVEILTEEGWKKYNTINIGEQVATYNLKNNSVEFKPILNIHQYNYQGEMITFHNKKLNLTVTPNHRVILKNKKAKAEAIIKIASQIDDDNILINTAKWKYPINFTFTTDELAKLIGVIIGDGSLIKNKKGIIYGTRIYQKQGKKAQIIESLLTKCHINYLLHSTTRIPDKMNCYYIGKKENKEFIKLIEKIIPHKKLNRMLLSLPKPQLKLLYDGLILSDGSKQKKNIALFWQKDYNQIQLFEELVLRLGKRFSTRIDYSGFKPESINYCTIISNKLDTRISNYQKHITKHVYNGLVWCPETINGTWIAKSKGTVCITGNSHFYQELSDNCFHLGSIRFVRFDEVKYPKKYIGILEIGDLDKSFTKIPLSTPYPMWELHLQKLMDKTGILDLQNDPPRQVLSKLAPSNPPNLRSFGAVSDLLSFTAALPEKTKVKVIIEDFDLFKEYLVVEKDLAKKFYVYKRENRFDLNNIVTNTSAISNKPKELNMALIKFMELKKVDPEIQGIIKEEIK
jgi:hypothetical protein